MDKIQLDVSKPVEESIKYNDKEILVKKYISFDEQVVLTMNYCSAYFSPSSDNTIRGRSDWDYFGAEYSLRLNILNTCTNLLIFNVDNSVANNVDNIFYSDLWDEITMKILNYNTFRFSLDRVVDDIKKQIANRESLGPVLNGLANKLSSAIDQLSKLDLSQENLERIKSTAESVTKSLENSPVGEIFKEAGKSG